VLCAQALGDELLDGLGEQFPLSISKNVVRMAIGECDESPLVYEQYCIGHCLEYLMALQVLYRHSLCPLV
jgi:hypothetical protein